MSLAVASVKCRMADVREFHANKYD